MSFKSPDVVIKPLQNVKKLEISLIGFFVFPFPITLQFAAHSSDKKKNIFQGLKNLFVGQGKANFKKPFLASAKSWHHEILTIKRS